jgi:uncharacterized protein YciI
MKTKICFVIPCCVFLLVGFSGWTQPTGYTLVFLNKKAAPVPLPKQQLDSIMTGHLQNIERLATEGELLAAGPFEGGGGLFILKTTSTAEARDLLSTDPGVQADRWDVEILPYFPRIGSVCPVTEPYEMVTYKLVRFEKNVTKANARDYPKLFFAHDEFIKKLSTQSTMITEATFGDLEGGLIVVSGELDSEVIASDPAVQAGLLVPEIKSLWIARGSFCER